MSKTMHCFYILEPGTFEDDGEYPGIPYNKIIYYHNMHNYYLYAITPDKSICKDFISQRDMTKFIEKRIEVNDEDIEEYLDIYSGYLIEDHIFPTAAINSHGVYYKSSAVIRCTTYESDAVLYSDFETLVGDRLYDELYQLVFRNKNVLHPKMATILNEIFHFDDFMAYVIPLEDYMGDDDTRGFDIDALALYCHLFKPTYKWGTLV